MADNVMYFRGPFPPGYFQVSEAMVSDLRRFIAISEDSFGVLCSELRAFDGFLDEIQCEQLIERVISEQPERVAAQRTLRFMDQQRRSGPIRVERILHSIDQVLANSNASALTDNERKTLLVRLPKLIHDVAGLELQAKAERLGTATGNRLQKAEVICDLRPVFDHPAREDVKGLIPVTTLKLICEGTDGLPFSVEAVLTARDVEKLWKEVQSAKNKLTKLREVAEELPYPIPTTEMTLTGTGDD